MASGAGDKDIDLQVVENIPRETLVALLKRKDKEAKTLQSKVEKLEEKYVKVVRFNKLLMEDRNSFQRFCRELLPESDGVFEEAAAQEQSANLNELLKQLSSWRSNAEAANEDRQVFKQFVELVFPGSESTLQLFNQPSLGVEAFDALQQRWMEMEDLHNQSIASINSMARDQVMAKTEELEASQSAHREAERKVQELKQELTGFAREKAKVLKQKLHGGDIQEGSSSAAVDTEGAPSSSSRAWELELQQLQDQKVSAERREREARDSAERQRVEMQAMVDQQRSEVRRLRQELEIFTEEDDLRQKKAAQAVHDKEAVLEKLKARTSELEQELSSNDFITRIAEQQAGRDSEIKVQQRQVNQLTQTLTEIQRLLGMSYSQEKVLKDRIRELESSQGRSHVAGDYLKHVVLKYVEYCQTGDLKAQSLVPVLCTLLNLTPTERRAVEHPSIPQPLLMLNQAVGGAGSWLRGDTSSITPPADLPPMPPQ